MLTPAKKLLCVIAFITAAAMTSQALAANVIMVNRLNTRIVSVSIVGSCYTCVQIYPDKTCSQVTSSKQKAFQMVTLELAAGSRASPSYLYKAIPARTGVDYCEITGPDNWQFRKDNPSFRTKLNIYYRFEGYINGKKISSRGPEGNELIPCQKTTSDIEFVIDQKPNGDYVVFSQCIGG